MLSAFWDTMPAYLKAGPALPGSQLFASPGEGEAIIEAIWVSGVGLTRLNRRDRPTQAHLRQDCCRPTRPLYLQYEFCWSLFKGAR